jgi:hypothetical protein
VSSRNPVKARLMQSLNHWEPGELISLFLIRAALMDVPRSELDEALLDLERERKISLKVVNTPYLLEPTHRKACIDRGERGFLGYAMVR